VTPTIAEAHATIVENGKASARLLNTIATLGVDVFTLEWVAHCPSHLFAKISKP
jgi:hypothetical protein